MSVLSWMQPHKKDEVALPLQVPEIRDQASYHQRRTRELLLMIFLIFNNNCFTSMAFSILNPTGNVDSRIQQRWETFLSLSAARIEECDIIRSVGLSSGIESCKEPSVRHGVGIGVGLVIKLHNEFI